MRSNALTLSPVRLQEPSERGRVHDAAGLQESGHHARRCPAERTDPPGPGAAGAQRRLSGLQLARVQRLAGLTPFAPTAPQCLRHLVKRQQWPCDGQGRRCGRFAQTGESKQQVATKQTATFFDNHTSNIVCLTSPMLLFFQMTFQQICKDVHMVKTNGQQMFIESRNRPPPRKNTSTGKIKRISNSSMDAVVNTTSSKNHLFLSTLHPGPTNIRAVTSDPIRGLIADLTKPPKALVPAPLVQKEAPTGYSYQQINCLDSIIRCVCVCAHLKLFYLIIN